MISRRRGKRNMSNTISGRTERVFWIFLKLKKGIIIKKYF